MKRLRSLTRRALLRLGVSLALAGTSGARGASAGTFDTDPRVEKLLSVLPAGASAIVVGRACIAAGIGSEGVAALVDLLSEGRRRAALSTETVRDQLRRSHHRDLDVGRVHRVHGFVLSETEARLYALAALRAHVTRRGPDLSFLDVETSGSTSHYGATGKSAPLREIAQRRQVSE
ncbi:MAG: hypothetical protein V3T07_08540 [Myxococcota bacterium]